MGYVRSAFLLIELLILILLVTFLISLFMGGQAGLLKTQSDATKKLQELNALLNEREQAPGRQSAPPLAERIKRYVITRPVLTGDLHGIPEKWAPKIECFVAVCEPQNHENRLSLPLIGFAARARTV